VSPLDRFDRLAQQWQRQARDDHKAADRLQGIEKKLARTHASTREALANELARKVAEARLKDG
jgi:hypothetical protein